MIEWPTWCMHSFSELSAEVKEVTPLHSLTSSTLSTRSMLKGFPLNMCLSKPFHECTDMLTRHRTASVCAESQTDPEVTKKGQDDVYHSSSMMIWKENIIITFDESRTRHGKN